MADEIDVKIWDPCKPFLQFTAALLVISTSLAVAVLTSLPDLEAGREADGNLAEFYAEFLAAVAQVIIAGTIVGTALAAMRSLLPPRPVASWEDFHYVASLLGLLGCALLAILGWHVAEVAIDGWM